MTKSKDNPDMRILKKALCPTISARSKLSYQIGATPDNEIHIRIMLHLVDQASERSRSTKSTGSTKESGRSWRPAPDGKCIICSQALQEGR